MKLVLTKRGEYAIRLLMRLGERAGERLTAAELAELCDIPAGNVPTIVNLLARSGLLVASPGRGGGAQLARDPSEISMLEIIEVAEGALEISHCLLDSRRCHDRDPECAVHQAWVEGRDAAIRSLAETSLADTIRREREIARTARRGSGRRGSGGGLAGAAARRR
jgi:Rrf2 family nitric oxide-sensitive transcriptional repressor